MVPTDGMFGAKRASILLSAAALFVLSPSCKKHDETHSAHGGHGGGAAVEEGTVAAGGTLTVRVDGDGYHPARVLAPAGAAITLSFLRTTDMCCGETLKIPSMNVQRALPLNQAVAVAVQVPASGALQFTCGMDMYRGSVVVR